MQKPKLHWLVLSFLVIVIAIGSQSFQYVAPNFQQGPPERKLQNVKAYPSTMTFKQVDHEMDKFKGYLNVKCNYCHAPSKTNPQKLDMASDENPMKEVARNMIRMTIDMNEKYISKIPHNDTTTVQLITCGTCHKGTTKPEPLVASVK